MSSAATPASEVVSHYQANDPVTRVAAALAAAGLGSGTVRWDQLSGLDQFHTGGLRSTRRLTEALDLAADQVVLDVGSGIGGPDRYLAATYGCHVTGVDLTPAFVDVATLLSERSGLSALTTFQQADALHLPFADEAFDRVLSQHVAMNIRDRAALYGEVRRVVRPGGLVGFHDVAQGPAGPLQYPVPWAESPAHSHLLTPDEMRSGLVNAGFAVVSFEDVTDATLAWGPAAAPPDAPASPLRLGAVMGPAFRDMAANLQRNLEEGRAGVVLTVLRRV